MTFEELTNLTDPTESGYYELLLSNSTIILLEVAKTSKKRVAEKIGLLPSAFSGVYSCIVAHNILTKGK